MRARNTALGRSTLGLFLGLSFSLARGAAPAAPAAIRVEPVLFYLVSGEEVRAKPSGMDGNILLVEADGHPRKLPLSRIAAVKSGGELSNGPFDAPRLREILGLPAPAAEIPPADPGPASAAPALTGAGAAAAPDPGSGREYYVYGEKVSTPYIVQLPGPSFTTTGGSVTKIFTRCVSKDGQEKCGSPRWIGLFGEDLSAALAEAPAARAVADRIKTTTAIQGLSLVALPIFLFSGISAANGPEDGYGKVHTRIGPASIILFGLTGAAFANYVGWNVYEGYLARKAIRIYNEKIGIKVSAAPGGAFFATDIGF